MNIAVGGVALALGALGIAQLRLPADPQTTPPGEMSLAVLPVESLPGNPADDALAEGLTEQIAYGLSTSGYPVVALDAIEESASRSRDLTTLGTQLAVTHVIDGSVRREGDRMRIALRLVETAAGQQPWSELYEEPATDRFAMQDRVAARVVFRTFRQAEVYDRSVYEPELEDAMTPAREQEVIELNAEGRRLFFTGEWEASISLRQRAIDLLPKRRPFLRVRGDAQAEMSISQANLYVFGSVPFEEASPKMLRLAEAAVAEAPTSAYAHVSLSRALVHHWRWEAAERELQRVCELAPRKARVDMGSSSIGLCGVMRAGLCAALGCVEDQLEGARLYESQFSADVAASGFWLPWAFINNNRLEEAEQASLRAAASGPGAATFLARVQWRLGRRSEAVATLGPEVAAVAAPENARALERAAEQSPEAAWRLYAELQASGALGGARNLDAFASASTYAELGEMDVALDAIEHSFAEHEAGMEMFACDPIFDSIGDTPRFRALIEQMRLTAYHEKHGVFERARQRVARSDKSDSAHPGQREANAVR
jgi:TolB-like protein